MGYAVLYIAFGIVALWLLGEVLLQYKARLRFRVLAFCGFLGVVAGVGMGQVVVIVLGALAFGTGQTFVTLSYKRGFSTGWALGGQPGSSRRRKGGAARPEPVLEVGPVEEDDFAAAGADSGTGGQPAVGADRIADPVGAREDVYQPVPLHEDSGEYPAYDGPPAYSADPYAGGGYQDYGNQGGQGNQGYQDWGTGQQPAAASYGYQNGQDAQNGGYTDAGGWGGDQAAAQYGGQQQAYGYDQGGYQQQPAAGYDYAQATGDWTPQPQPPADPYGYGHPYQQEQQQPYIPQQQAPYEPGQQQGYQQPQQPYEQQPYDNQQQQPQYADPYDPYRY
ncbi:hypothetical protein [Streptomyces sp. NBC_01198]|uniref:hypothetical protein n=1 Tax=Streptomyces sp. NBC_01198 TaxID=2903769 RepID=UPI002E0EBB1D|nr:hypothetical protein OG702_27170 [Streptomyces sp. NBC_01198]